MDDRTAGPVRGPDFRTEILFGPVRGPDFGPDFCMNRKNRMNRMKIAVDLCEEKR